MGGFRSRGLEQASGPSNAPVPCCLAVRWSPWVHRWAVYRSQRGRNAATAEPPPPAGLPVGYNGRHRPTATRYSHGRNATGARGRRRSSDAFRLFGARIQCPPGALEMSGLARLMSSQTSPGQEGVRAAPKVRQLTTDQELEDGLPVWRAVKWRSDAAARTAGSQAISGETSARSRAHIRLISRTVLAMSARASLIPWI